MLGQKRKRILLVVCSLASFLVPYTVSSLNVALPAISESFSIDAVTLGWVTSAYLLTAAICIVPFGRLSDLYGRKRFFLIGNGLFALGSLLAALSWSGSVIILARVIQALGGAMVFSTSIAIVTDVFPPGERGKAIGIITATVYAGLSLGPFIGGVLTSNVGWPSIFLLNIPLALIVIALTLLYIPEEWAEKGEKTFDLFGAVLYGIMLFGVIYGMTLLPSPPGVFFMISGLVVLGVFVWWENREQAPIIDLTLFTKSPVFLFSNIAALINYAVVFAVGFLLGFTLQLFFDAAQLAGQICGVQMGYSLASILNPDSQADSTVLATFYQLVVLVLFIQLSVPHWLLRGLARSYEYLPPGRLSLTRPAVSALLEFASGMWIAGMQIAAPVVVASLFADVALGFLGKASPQLPVLFLGISLKNLLGLALLAGSAAFWPRFFDARFERALEAAERILKLAR
jgi:flagellar biosynthetic protein FliR